MSLDEIVKLTVALASYMRSATTKGGLLGQKSCGSETDPQMNGYSPVQTEVEWNVSDGGFLRRGADS